MICESQKPARLSLTDPAFRITVPPGEVMFAAALRGRERLYTRAHLSDSDRAKGLGIVADRFPLEIYNAYTVVDVPDTSEPFSIELRLSRGLTGRGRVVGPDGKPVTGAHCYGLALLGMRMSRNSMTTRSRSWGSSRAVPGS